MILVSFTTHTDTTLSILSDVLKGMGEYEKVCALICCNSVSHEYQDLATAWGISLTTPKHHFVHSHLVASIRSKGPVCNTDTGMGEARHPESKHAYANSNKHPDTAQDQVSDIRY